MPNLMPNFQVRISDADLGNKKPRIIGAFLQAAEGTRTLDLLHGKQTL